MKSMKKTMFLGLCACVSLLQWPYTAQAAKKADTQERVVSYQGDRKVTSPCGRYSYVEVKVRDTAGKTDRYYTAKSLEGQFKEGDLMKIRIVEQNGDEWLGSYKPFQGGADFQPSVYLFQSLGTEETGLKRPVIQVKKLDEEHVFLLPAQRDFQGNWTIQQNVRDVLDGLKTGDAVHLETQKRGRDIVLQKASLPSAR